MSKKCEVSNCNECPHMDNVYYNYERECMLLGKVLSNEMCDIHYEIYEGCPLKDWNEE